MADQNVSIEQDTVVVTGGSTTLNVDTNFGGQGARGSLILYGLGKPTDPGVVFYTEPQLLDWYINIDNSDDEYLYIYQYIYANANSTWSRVFKIIPNVYQTNKLVTFNSLGIGVANVSVSNTTLPLVSQSDYPNVGSTIFPVANESEMLAINGAIGTYAFRTDLAKYFYLSALPASDAVNWQGLIAINAHVGVENENPVASSFQVGIPQIVTNQETGVITYTLPITIVAYQLVSSPTPDETVPTVADLLTVTPLSLGPDGIYSVYVTAVNATYILTGLDPSDPENWTLFPNAQPITGNKTVHISINVI